MEFKRFAQDAKENIAQTILNFENITLSNIEIRRLLVTNKLEKKVDGNDALIIRNLLRTLDFIDNIDLSKVIINLELYKRLNGIIAFNQALNPGEIRDGNVFIPCINEPIAPARLSDIENQIDDLNKINNYNYKEVIAQSFMNLSRIQPFNDGNKRTALFICNISLAKYDLGFLSIPNEQYDDFEKELTVFYKDNNVEPLKYFIIKTSFVKNHLSMTKN